MSERDDNYKKFMEEVENTPTTVQPAEISQHAITGISTDAPEKFDNTYREIYKELMQKLKVSDPQLMDVVYDQLKNSQVIPENLEQTVQELLEANGYLAPAEKTSSDLMVETIDDSAAQETLKTKEQEKTEAEKSSFIPQVATPTASQPANRRDDLTNEEQEIDF